MSVPLPSCPGSVPIRVATSPKTETCGLLAAYPIGSQFVRIVSAAAPIDDCPRRVGCRDEIGGLDLDRIDGRQNRGRPLDGDPGQAQRRPRVERGISSISPVLTAAGVAGLVLVGMLIVSSGARRGGACDVDPRLATGADYSFSPCTLGTGRAFLARGIDLALVRGRLSIASACWIRWIRESINNLLPVASIGGDVALVRLTHLEWGRKRGGRGQRGGGHHGRRGHPAHFRFGGRDSLADPSLQRRRGASGGAGRVDRHSGFRRGADDFRVAAASKYGCRVDRGRAPPGSRGLASRRVGSRFGDRRGGGGDLPAATALVRACVLRLATWIIGAGEVWLVTYFLGRPLFLIDALILESLGNGIYAAAFVVRGALGVLEGGYVMFGALFGLPADISLTISLSKRVRELLLGLPGLLAWQWEETRGLRRRKGSALITGSSASRGLQPAHH